VTLDSLQVDGKDATILVEGGRFATLVKGRGRHRVVLGLQVPVHRESGPPRVDLQIPRIPVSSFELSLPGKVELTVLPASNVATRVEKGITIATANVPMTDHVSFAWSEAIPDELQTEVRVNAATYHAVHASEGVLYVHAMLQYEVSRGETNRIELSLPPSVQVERIDSNLGAVSDWRVGQPDKNGNRVVTVFLDRQLRGSLIVNVLYDRSLGGDVDLDAIGVPLIQPIAAQRQRGMVALLSGRELTLNPVDEGGATRVGENQIPAFVREGLEMTVAHTFKYTEEPPLLVVAAAVPERVEGKFDALVDTLVSLGDVTLAASTSVAVNVKSGRTMALRLELPADVNLLSLSAPSLRTHKVTQGESGQIVDLEFTQEMEGQFRIDLSYERIMAADDPEVRVPTLSVTGAEVEQGRIAVEALSAVEVRPASAEQLSTLDVNELPRQLVLRTTNPILLAYKYVHADPAPALVLQVTRHDLVAVQEAAIGRADYRTLFTPDGLVVTMARFTVRNSRKQFLRVELPEGSEIWSAFVDGKAEKPALGEETEESQARPVLIKIINSAEPFAVELVYATSGSRIGHLGSVEGLLPRPDVLVTDSRWDVYLPDGFRYAEPRSNMELVESAIPVSRQKMADAFAALERAPAGGVTVEPLRITVPASGVHYAFEKLYANQTGREAWFRVPYVSARGRMIGRLLSIAGVALLWAGIGLRLRKESPALLRTALTLILIGLAALVVAVRVCHTGTTLPLLLSLAAALLLFLLHGRRYLDEWRHKEIPESA
jgi:hypothetical protein